MNYLPNESRYESMCCNRSGRSAEHEQTEAILNGLV